MITGFNTEVEHDSKVYHVQTEDKGLENPYIESLVYMGGAIIFSKRTDYKEKLVKGITEKAAIAFADALEPSQNINLRIRAAKMVLDYYTKYKELIEFDERLKTIESRLKNTRT